MSKPRLISFYLPQFYPTVENDQWWHKGFTEWTNVGSAKPLFPGHYQPRVPADLGYYDLRIPEVREQQAELARQAGIEGFCYWHYWFAGRRLLDRVFREIVDSGSPQYPFCLCWANHSWYQKTWNKNSPDHLLMEQTYPGVNDYVAHFNAMLPAFKDERYIKVNGRLLFGVFKPLDIPDPNLFIRTWNKLANDKGLNGFYFFGFTYHTSELQRILDVGYDVATIDYTIESIEDRSKFVHFSQRIFRKLFGWPFYITYDHYVDYFKRHMPIGENIVPCIIPNFDHSPRSANKGSVIHKSTPEKWREMCKWIFRRNNKDNIVFVKAWNEWGEGNYLEPDMKYGKGYIHALRDAIDNL